MRKYTSEELVHEETYSKEEILDAALITHPKAKSCNLTEDDLKKVLIFENGSNLKLLKNPIKDEFWNEYRCSEWYYMAQRTNSLAEKQIIAFLSTWFSLAMKARELFKLEQDDIKRAEYMRKAIKAKFDNNPELKEELMRTWNKAIIEYTYRKDTRFWIDQETLKGMNILWKVMMEYRDWLKERKNELESE